MDNFKCPKCGNRSRFRVLLPAWHCWAIDSAGLRLEKLSEEDDDAELESGYTVWCDKCDHDFEL